MLLTAKELIIENYNYKKCRNMAHFIDLHLPNKLVVKKAQLDEINIINMK